MSWFAIEGCCDSHAIRECISCPDIIWGSLPCKKARNEERTSAGGAAPPGRSSLAARMEKVDCFTKRTARHGPRRRVSHGAPPDEASALEHHR